MRLEAVRILTAWLGHATYGVNAKLAALALDGSDVRPSNVATITDETQNLSAALHRFDGLTLPAIIVSALEVTHRDSEIAQPGDRADGAVTLRVRYATRKIDGAAAVADGSYMLKAVLASLRELHKTANVASRTRNNVVLVSCEELRELSVFEEVDDAWLIDALEVRYYATDLAPLGA